MKLINFEFLRDKLPEFANLGGFAERYALPDPESAFLKLRLFIDGSMVERFIKTINTFQPKAVIPGERPYVIN